jgi:Synaptobrevin
MSTQTQKLQNETKEVTELMQINVQKVVQRGENLGKLQEKSADLQQNSLIFKKGAQKVTIKDLNLGRKTHVVEKSAIKYDNWRSWCDNIDNYNCCDC